MTFPYVIIIIIYVPIFYDDNESECSGEMEKEMTTPTHPLVESNPENKSFKNIYEKILQTISKDDDCSMREKKNNVGEKTHYNGDLTDSYSIS